MRRQLGVPEDAPLYGHIGRFCQQKNHGYLLDIFEQILKRQPRARLVLLGEGDMLEAIKAKAAQLGARGICWWRPRRPGCPALCRTRWTGR